jgi:hypothetical protein
VVDPTNKININQASCQFTKPAPSQLQIGLTLHPMKPLKTKAFLLIGMLVLAMSCSDKANNEMADNALDGGRYFLENCNQGDFNKAINYLLDNPENRSYFKGISLQYFALDKEGRQQLRQASIQINEVKAIDSNQTIISYQSSLDKIPHQLKVVNSPKGWKVDLKYTYSPK